MPTNASPDQVAAVGKVLLDENRPLKERFRALFTLKNLGGSQSIDCISKCFDDPSALLKHELAYCLGQMQDEYAIPILKAVLKDKKQEVMVRHEAGEALGAIGSKDVLDLLEEYSNDTAVEVAETCQLAAQRIRWLQSSQSKTETLPDNPFMSVDPTPPAETDSTEQLRERLLDEKLTLFDRYRAMFTLRNKGDTDSVLALAEGLKCSSALFRHEVAFVLGQMQHAAGTKQLAENLRDTEENPMVRHECAEALGAIATEETTKILAAYLQDENRVVKESCVVALDMSEYENSKQFQYADKLSVGNGNGEAGQ